LKASEKLVEKLVKKLLETKLYKNMASELEEIEIEGSPKIYCEEWMNPPMVSGNWIPGLIETIGGI